MRRLLVGLGLLLGSGVLVVIYGLPAFEVAFRLAFGWWSYLARVVPRVAVSWDAVTTGVGCLVVFATGLHLFLRWLHGEIGRARDPAGRDARRWKPRWTASIVAVVVLMFVAGIGATGLAHQVGWLASSRRPHLVPRVDAVSGTYRDGSVGNLREIGAGVSNFLAGYESLPVGRADAQGRRLQSWQRDILIYLSWRPGGEIRDDLPWDDPRNSAYFRGIVPPYLNPEIGAIRSPEGYALSHYAGNVRVLGAGNLPPGRVMGNASGTIVAGEVAAGFKPWGDPSNLRDPALGIHRSPDSFGGPTPGGANFLFLDGSVRFLKDGIDPKVLRALSTPTGPG